MVDITHSDLLVQINLPLEVLRTICIDDLQTMNEEQSQRYQAFVLGFIMAVADEYNYASKITDFLRFYTQKRFQEHAEVMLEFYCHLIAVDDAYLLQKRLGYEVAHIMRTPGSIADKDPESMFRAAVWGTSAT